MNCGKIHQNIECKKCGHKKFKSARSGDVKTAQELGRIFNSTPTLLSNANNPITTPVDDRSRIIIATPGAEPRPVNGYVASIILDVETIYELPVFWAETESYRRWLNVAGMTKTNGTVVIDGNIAEETAKNLQTWNIDKTLDTILDERKELQLPPHVRLVSIYGANMQIEDAVNYLEKEHITTMGVIPKTSTESMTICMSQIAETKIMLDKLKTYMKIRSVKKMPKLRIQVDPIQLW